MLNVNQNYLGGFLALRLLDPISRFLIHWVCDGRKICISTKSPGDSKSASLGTPLWKWLLYTHPSFLNLGQTIRGSFSFPWLPSLVLGTLIISSWITGRGFIMNQVQQLSPIDSAVNKVDPPFSCTQLSHTTGLSLLFSPFLFFWTFHSLSISSHSHIQWRTKQNNCL